MKLPTSYIGEKLSNWRILSSYTEKAKERLRRLQALYCKVIHNSEDTKAKLSATYLETNEDGIPLCKAELDSLTILENKEEPGPLESYFMEIKLKILQYLAARRDDPTSYSNDPQALFSVHMIREFHALLSESAITMDLSTRIESWIELVTLVKVNSKNSNDMIFSRNEERQLGYTMVALLGNISAILLQAKDEVILEINRRTISDHLCILYNVTKLHISTIYHYIVNATTYEKLPIDFTLASYYDKFLKIETLKNFCSKPWFRCLYEFARSECIRDMYFPTGTVHSQINELMEKNHKSANDQERLTTFDFTCSESGMPSEKLVSVVKIASEKSPSQRSLVSGLHQLFYSPETPLEISELFSLLTKLISLTKITHLIRLASDLLRNDGSLISNKDTQLQLSIFVELFCRLTLEINDILTKLSSSVEHQSNSNIENRSIYTAQNPNVSTCLALKKFIALNHDSISMRIRIVLDEIKKVDINKNILKKKIQLFKQQWTYFVSNHFWLLSPSHLVAYNNISKSLRSSEQCVRVMSHIDIEPLLAKPAKRLKTLITSKSPIPPHWILNLLRLEINANLKHCHNIFFLNDRDLVSSKIYSHELDQLPLNKRIAFLITPNQSSYPSLLVVTRSSKNLKGIYVDSCGDSERDVFVRGYCKANDIELESYIGRYAQDYNAAILVYHQLQFLCNCDPSEFSVFTFSKNASERGHENENILNLLRCSIIRSYLEWFSNEQNNTEEDIVVDDQVLRFFHDEIELRIDTNNYITYHTFSSILKTFEKLTLIVHLNSQLMSDDIKNLAHHFENRCKFSFYNGNENVTLSGFDCKNHPHVVFLKCLEDNITDKRMLSVLVNFIASSKNTTLHINKLLAGTGNTLLHEAVKLLRLDAIEHLLLAGIDITLKNKNGDTATDIAIHLESQDERKELIIKLLTNTQPSLRPQSSETVTPSTANTSPRFF